LFASCERSQTGASGRRSAQILGSFDASTESWLWAWANSSIRAEMSRDSRVVRAWGERHGQAAFAQGRVRAGAEKAETLFAVAVRITRAAGCYRGSGYAAVPYLTFGDVTVRTADGEPSVFRVELE
jgi:hypothetical protein